MVLLVLNSAKRHLAEALVSEYVLILLAIEVVDVAEAQVGLALMLYAALALNQGVLALQGVRALLLLRVQRTRKVVRRSKWLMVLLNFPRLGVAGPCDLRKVLGSGYHLGAVDH